jgi:ABC-type glycerol-3-phosphate transport system substrate-binding protein
MHDYKRIARGVLVAAGAAALVAFVAAVRPADLSDHGRRTVIRIWHIWAGPMLESFRRSVDAFERSHPAVACELLYVPNDLSNNQKFYTAVVGNCAPEVIFVDGPQVAEWAERGLLTDLGPLLAEAGRDRQQFEDEFWAPCWRQCEYRGKIWAITWCADPNFCFFWNKEAFRKAIAEGEIPPQYAGRIDPEKPPGTLDEMDLWNDAITRYEDGRLVRIGVIPWGFYGRANSIFTWGWAFGGEFYDPENFKITANDPNIVKALEWMCSYAKKYDVQRIDALQSTFGSAEQNPFSTGKQVMQLYHVTGLDEMRRYAPDLDYGTGPIPQPPGGEKDSSWVGGWTMAIPSSLADPAKRRAAMEYILWTCASAEGTHWAVRTSAGFPGWKAAPFFEEAAKDPHAAVFIEILRKCKHQRPVMPAQAYYMDQLDRAVDRAVRGELSPREALDDATRNTQAFLDKILSRHGGPGGRP